MPRNMPTIVRINRVSHSAMVERPDLAVYIARIATGWSRVEQGLGNLVVQFLGAHAHTGIKMYEALSGSASKLAVLRAVARDRLSRDQLDQLEEVLRSVKSVGRKRSKVVHGLWEISDQLPRALVWCDSADAALSNSEFWAGWLSRDLDERFQWAANLHAGHGPRYFVYEERDFQEIVDEIQSLLARLLILLHDAMKLNEPPGVEAPGT